MGACLIASACLRKFASRPVEVYYSAIADVYRGVGQGQVAVSGTLARAETVGTSSNYPASIDLPKGIDPDILRLGMAVIHLSQLFVGLHRAQRPARVRIGRPAAAVSQFIDDRVAQHADLRDLNLDHVARLHEQRRRTLGADAARRSGNDDAPWQQGNSRPRTEALAHPVRLRAGTTALRRFVQ
jgi:hypothetical protein